MSRADLARHVQQTVIVWTTQFAPAETPVLLDAEMFIVQLTTTAPRRFQWGVIPLAINVFRADQGRHAQQTAIVTKHQFVIAAEHVLQVYAEALTASPAPNVHSRFQWVATTANSVSRADLVRHVQQTAIV